MSTTELVHASCVGIGRRCVLLAGPSGCGKSDLALRLIDRGAMLLSDDYTLCEARDGELRGIAPERIAGHIEVRGVGILPFAHEGDLPIRLHLDLTAAVDRLPAPATRRIAGVDLPSYALAPFEASAPIKVELLLAALPA